VLDGISPPWLSTMTALIFPAPFATEPSLKD
jgi:hypothetical protein